MKENHKNENTRQIYHEPEIEKVELVADEAVLTNCKGAGAAGKNGYLGCRPHTHSCKISFGS